MINADEKTDVVISPFLDWHLRDHHNIIANDILGIIIIMNDNNIYFSSLDDYNIDSQSTQPSTEYKPCQSF